MKTVKDIYFAGYSAFEKGNYEKAAKLARKCLRIAKQDSYWYSGALGLCCWTANFTGDHTSVEQYAHVLLAVKTGDQKAWFDAVASFNLGLTHRKNRRLDEANIAFSNAAQCYSTFLKQGNHPTDWTLIIRLFFSIAMFAMDRDKKHFVNLLDRISQFQDTSEVVKNVKQTIKIYLRHSSGEDVKKDAIKIVQMGVSRTFLAYILLDV